ncbi:hypothetical protein GCM10022278_07260 [Allohahella marinimesophila]|uniref:Aminoglycoside phosphotransferase domain-containing protein n=1 Tax=Allohahella marinimesophila TaxID=1054972 RepID=A0ABP7NN17_9GAMM
MVEEVIGRPPVLPADLDAIMATLAAIHALDLPDRPARRPLPDLADPLRAMHDEVSGQARYLSQVELSPGSENLLQSGLSALAKSLHRHDRPPVSLITFDAHPGNFLIDESGKAWMVDLEKARYSHAGFDLAHATLYTSTTWDLRTHAVLEAASVIEAYRQWAAYLADLRGGESASVLAHLSWQADLRRAMWLWSSTWCAKWLATAAQNHTGHYENWDRNNNADTLNRHVEERARHYLSQQVLQQVSDEIQLIGDAFR